MPTPLESLVASGTKLWLDSIDPELVRVNRRYGATGATSNPIIIADLIKTGRFDDQLRELMDLGFPDDAAAWNMTDRLVRQAQQVFADVHEQTRGDDGYVSFELDPLLEDADSPLSLAERTRQYVTLGKQWSEGHRNRMIKVPATPAGLGALEELAAAGVPLNVTLIFTPRQYRIAREAIWRGAQQRAATTSPLDAATTPPLNKGGPGGFSDFKSVYSIFISRIDVYTKQHVPELSPAAQGQVGIVNVKRLWRDNQQFWRDKDLPLKQEIIFASTGTKDPSEPPDKYVSALAGSDIQTNPPATNDAIQQMTGKTFTRTVDQFPPQDVLEEIDRQVDVEQLEAILMAEGLKKFADPQKALLKLIAEKRAALATV